MGYFKEVYHNVISEGKQDDLICGTLTQGGF